MAIPFNLPSYEDTENNYRGLDELFAQLYRVLRQILMRQEQHVPVPNIEQHRHGRVHHHHHHHHQAQAQPQPQAEEVDAPAMPDVLPRLPLPDVVMSCSPAAPPSTSAPVTSPAQSVSLPLPPPRGPDKEAEAASSPHKVEVRDNWTQVGSDLRQIADEFSCASLEDIDPKRLQESSSPKGMNLLSLLVPPSFRGPVWMAVVLLFGWQVFQRTR